MNDLYKTISGLCEERGITVYKLCKDIGIRGSVLSDLKTGRKRGLSTDTLSKISGYFKLPMDYFLCTNDFTIEDTLKHVHDLEKEKAPILSDERAIKDPDIRMIARAGRKMTPEQRENLRKYAQYMYPEAFKDDDT